MRSAESVKVIVALQLVSFRHPICMLKNQRNNVNTNNTGNCEGRIYPDGESSFGKDGLDEISGIWRNADVVNGERPFYARTFRPN